VDVRAEPLERVVQVVGVEREQVLRLDELGQRPWTGANATSALSAPRISWPPVRYPIDAGSVVSSVSAQPSGWPTTLRLSLKLMLNPGPIFHTKPSFVTTSAGTSSETRASASCSSVCCATAGTAEASAQLARIPPTAHALRFIVSSFADTLLARGGIEPTP